MKHSNVCIFLAKSKTGARKLLIGFASRSFDPHAIFSSPIESGEVKFTIIMRKWKNSFLENL
jgi:hypothetical protein